MLTGRIGVRFNWRGKLIVQVMREIPCIPGHSGGMEWEDATIMTLIRAMEIAKAKDIPPFTREPQHCSLPTKEK